jgi:putative endonuclease
MNQIYTVYVLYSSTYDKIYIGYTSNLLERFRGQNELDKKGWTRSFRPWIVVYTEYFETKSEAMTREKQLKSGNGRAFIRQHINQYY